jgi:hypothetical protein
MERNGNVGLPVLVFCGRATTAPCGGEGGSRGRMQLVECNSPDQKMAAGCILSRPRESKMEIPAKAFETKGLLKPGCLGSRVPSEIPARLSS